MAAKAVCRQRGMSLISLMIGLLISMLGILAGIILYQSMVKVSLESQVDAAQDGQLASAMLTLQLELQSAGFGIDSLASPGPHLLLQAGPPPQLYWRFRETSTVPASIQCRAFRIEDTVVNERRQLQLLTPVSPASCTLESDLPGLPGGWEVKAVLAEFKAVAAAKLPVVTIHLAPASCFPFGVAEVGNYPQVTISADGSARRAAIDTGNATPAIAAQQYRFCLPNIRL